MLEVGKKTRVLGVDVHAVDMSEALDILVGWLSAADSAGDPPPCRYVVTPNLDHCVQLRENAELRAAYADASLVLADGAPLVWASRALRRDVPERVAGSDLTPRLLEVAPEGTRVFLLGAREESSVAAVAEIGRRYPQVRVVGRLSPDPGFEKSESESAEICRAIRESKAQLLLVGLGAPKQELWVHRFHEQLPGTVPLCIGATIDFISGASVRAPVWAQSLGLEWFHRLVSDPRRMVGRYGKDAIMLPRLVFDDLRQGSRQDVSSESPTE